MFEELTGDSAVLVKGGVYRPCPLFKRVNGDLFARYGSGYVRLYATGGTSLDGMKIEVMHTEAPLFVDRFGRLCTTAGEGRKALDGPAAQALLGAPECAK